MIHGKTLFGTYENLGSIKTGQDDGYTTGYLSNYFYFKETNEMIVIDYSKQQSFDTGLKDIQGINLY